MVGRVRAPSARWLGPTMVLVAASVDACGQCEINKLVPADSATRHAFGLAVSIAGDMLAVGAPKSNYPTPAYGGVHPYRRIGATWQAEQVLEGEQLYGNDGFGRSLALSGIWMLIGAPSEDPGGAAYVFQRSGGAWREAARFTSMNIESNDRFGHAVALDVDVAAISALRHPAVYIFRFDGLTWRQESELLGSDTYPSDDFGYSVGIDGDVVVVGARWADAGGLFNPGAAYVFERLDGLWMETAKLLPDPQHNIANFGTSVAISNGTIVVGSPGANAPGVEDSGAAFVFERDDNGDWLQKQRLLLSDAGPGEYAGTAVAIDGDTIVVGVPDDSDNGQSAGSAAIFVRIPGGEWVQSGKLTASDGTAGDQLADAVAVSGNLALLGAFHDQPNGDRSGSAYVFAVGPDDDGDGVMDACVCTGDIDGDWAVGQADLGILLSDYGGVPDDPKADLDGDGWITQADLGILLAHYGEVCP